MELLSFKDFMESYEKKANYMSSLQDELGIDPSALEKIPNWSPEMKMGNFHFNGVNYLINQFVKDARGDVKGAYITPFNIDGGMVQKKFHKGTDGNLRTPSNTVSDKKIFVPISKLNSMLTRGMGGNTQGMLPGMM
jgi:hypothetical protein